MWLVVRAPCLGSLFKPWKGEACPADRRPAFQTQGEAQLKLLHVINNLRFGGAEVLLRDSLPLMRDRGLSVSILILSDHDEEILKDIEGMGFNVLRSRARDLSSPAQVPQIRRLLKSADPDIVHVHLFPALYWTALACPRKGPGMVYTEHSTTNRRREFSFLRPVETLIYRRYERIICISDGVRRALLSWLPSLARRTVVVHNGVDIQRIRRARPAIREEFHPGCAPGDRLLVMVASFSRKKDQATVIRALGLLPMNFCLLLPGDGPAREDMKSLASGLGLGDRVSFPGNRPDIPDILKACDYAIQSSISEGFGLAAVESMAAGLPVLASRVSGLSEVVGDAGILFEPGNPEALACAILEVEKNGGTREALITRGLKRADRFRMENMVDNLISIYGTVRGRS
ncbi:MAG: glycosyltransferase [Candidatus Fermentibacteraceae bacterium]